MPGKPDNRKSSEVLVRDLSGYPTNRALRQNRDSLIHKLAPTGGRVSYDVYCYQPQSDTPDAKEAQALIQSEEGAVRRDDDEARGIKRRIADALLKYNPRLEPFKIDHNEVAKLMKITHKQAKAQWNHIELNPPQGDLRIQLQIHWDHVSLTIPYWYTGAKADEVFEQLSAYLRVIRDAAGFFAYDPQTNRAFDPQKEEFGEHGEYDRIAENLPQIIARGADKTAKPWWKN